VSVFQKTVHSEADVEPMLLQLLCNRLSPGKLFNAAPSQHSYGLKETGTKWWFLKLLNAFKKITPACHSHLEDLAFHLGHMLS